MLGWCPERPPAVNDRERLTSGTESERETERRRAVSAGLSYGCIINRICRSNLFLTPKRASFLGPSVPARPPPLYRKGDRMGLIVQRQVLAPNSCLERSRSLPENSDTDHCAVGGRGRAHRQGARRKADWVPGRNRGALEAPQLCRRGTAPIKVPAVPGPYRGAPQGDQGCPSRTGHQGLTSLILHDHGPYTAPHQVLSLGRRTYYAFSKASPQTEGRRYADPEIKFKTKPLHRAARNKIPVQCFNLNRFGGPMFSVI